jgi:hypothetical protein
MSNKCCIGLSVSRAQVTTVTNSALGAAASARARVSVPCLGASRARHSAPYPARLSRFSQSRRFHPNKGP